MKKLSKLSLWKKIFMAGVAFLVLFVLILTSTLKGQLLKKVEVGAQPTTTTPSAEQVTGTEAGPRETASPNPKTLTFEEPYKVVLKGLGGGKYEIKFDMPYPDLAENEHILDVYITPFWEEEVDELGRKTKRVIGKRVDRSKTNPWHGRAEGQPVDQVYILEVTEEDIKKAVGAATNTTLRLVYVIKESTSAFAPITRKRTLESEVPLTKLLDLTAPNVTRHFEVSEGSDLDLKPRPEEMAGFGGGDKCDRYKKLGGTIPTVKSAVCAVIVIIGESIERAVEGSAEWVLDVTEKYAKSAGILLEDWVEDGWNKTVTLVDVLAVVALIFIAFANILHIDLNVYGIKRALPALVLAIIAANLSLFLVRIVSGFGHVLAGSLTDSAIEGFGALARTVSELFTDLFLGALFGFESLPAESLFVAAAAPGYLVVLGFVLVVLFFIAAIAMLLIGFLILIQPGVVGVLTIFAPLAIVCAALPATQGIFKKWLSLIFNWIFMLPASLVLFALMDVLSAAGGPEDFASFESPVTNLFGIVGQIILLVLAVRLPFKMGGDIAAAWGAAGKFVGAQISNRLYYGALSAQSSAGAIQKQIDEAKEKGKPLPKLTHGQSWALWYGGRGKGGLAGVVASIHPRAVVEGFREKEARREAAIKGLTPPFSETFAKIAGKGAVFANDAPSHAEKMKWWSPKQLTDEFNKFQKRYQITPYEKDLAFTESPKAFEGKFDAGAIWSKIGGGDGAKGWALIREMGRRAPLTQYGEMRFPSVARRMIEEEIFTTFSDYELSIANRDETVLSDARLETELRGRYGDEEFPTALRRIREMQRRVRGRQRVGMPPQEEPAAGEEPLSEEEREEIERESSIFRTLQSAGKEGKKEAIPVEVVSPIIIDNIEQMMGINQAIQVSLDRMEEALKEQMTKEGLEIGTQNQILEAVRASHLNPAELAGLLEGRPSGVPGTVRLPPQTDLAIRQFGRAVQSGQLLTERTASQYSEKNLADVMPYINTVTGQVNQGRLRGEDIPAIQQRLELNINKLKSGQSLSPVELQALQADLRMVSPGVRLRPEISPPELLRIGNQVSNALSHINQPQVIQTLKTGAAPEQIRGMVIKQAASNLMRATNLNQMDNFVSKYQQTIRTAAPELQRQATQSILEGLRVQTASYIRNSPQFSGNFVRQNAESQKTVIHQVARSVAESGKPLDSAEINRVVSEAIKGAVGGAPSGAPAPGTPPAAGTPPPPPAGGTAPPTS